MSLIIYVQCIVVFDVFFIEFLDFSHKPYNKQSFSYVEKLLFFSFYIFMSKRWKLSTLFLHIHFDAFNILLIQFTHATMTANIIFCFFFYERKSHGNWFSDFSHQHSHWRKFFTSQRFTTISIKCSNILLCKIFYSRYEMFLIEFHWIE